MSRTRRNPDPDPDRPADRGDGMATSPDSGADARAGASSRADRLAAHLAELDRRLEAHQAAIDRLEARKRASIARGAPDLRRARNYRLLLAGARAEAVLGAGSAEEIEAIAAVLAAHPGGGRLVADAIASARAARERDEG